MPGPREVTDEMRAQMEEAERRITTMVDIRPVVDRKRDALLTHSSQIQDSWFSKIPPDIATEAFGFETFIRASDSTGTHRCPRTTCSPVSARQPVRSPG